MYYKKILILALLSSIIPLLFTFPVIAANCDWNWSVGSSLDGCLSDSNLVSASGPTLIEGSVKYQIIRWTTALWGVLGLLAVGAIVYGALLMTLSGGEDERIKKWKDVVKWSMVWFLWIVIAGGLVRIVIELIFSFTA